MKINYPKEAIELLIELIAGKEENAKILSEAGYSELALIYDSIRGNTSISALLKAKKEFIIASFLHAILDQDKKAFNFLMAQKATHWAATANAVNKDYNARAWLIKNDLRHYAILSDVIIKKMQETEGTGFEWLYKGPYSRT